MVLDVVSSGTIPCVGWRLKEYLEICFNFWVVEVAKGEIPRPRMRNVNALFSVLAALLCTT